MQKTHYYSLMVQKNNSCQQLTWLPSPIKKSDISSPYKEGKNLPNSIEEDIGTHQLCPTYSSKQIRRIKRISFEKKSKLNNKKTKLHQKSKTSTNFLLEDYT